MKKKNILRFIGIIAFAAVIGFSFISCGDVADDGVGGGGGGNSTLNGTWESSGGTNVTLVLSNGNFTRSQGNVEMVKGTYITGGNTMTPTVTHVKGAMFPNMGLSADQWYTQQEFRTALTNYYSSYVETGTMTQSQAATTVDQTTSSVFSPQTADYTLSGNTLTIQTGGSVPSVTVYTRQGGSNNNNNNNNNGGNTDDKIIITITGLPSTANDFFAIVSLYKTANTNDAEARSSAAKLISNGTVTGEMVQSGKNFTVAGSYFIRLEVYISETSTTVDHRLYDGVTTANQSIAKGSNTFAASLFTPAITSTYFPPKFNLFGTYTGVGYAAGVTETIVLNQSSLRISDSDDETPGYAFISFSIENWEEIPAASFPAEAVSGGYTRGYKFTGKITGGEPIGAASIYIYGTQTAPGFGQADINTTVCWMSVFFKGTGESVTLIRSRFSKEGNINDGIVGSTGANAQVRVYTKQQ